MDSPALATNDSVENRGAGESFYAPDQPSRSSTAANCLPKFPLIWPVKAFEFEGASPIAPLPHRGFGFSKALFAHKPAHCDPLLLRRVLVDCDVVAGVRAVSGGVHVGSVHSHLPPARSRIALCVSASMRSGQVVSMLSLRLYSIACLPVTLGSAG